MERYFKKLKPSELEGSPGPTSPASNSIHLQLPQIVDSQARVEVNLNELESDPGLRPHIYSIAHDPKELDDIRRAYWLKGPCQPKREKNEFPLSSFSGKDRRFNPDWFKQYGSWLEYSISKDAAFCLCCYLFKPDHGGKAGGEAFVTEGFRNWKKFYRLSTHVGAHNSSHNQCFRACVELTKRDYFFNLKATLRCIRYFLQRGLPFRSHDELEKSRDRENFIELLKLHAETDKEANKVVLENAPLNNQLIASAIQKDLVAAAATLTTRAIISDIGHELFSLLLKESHDVNMNEQIAVGVRYVDKKGCVIERFLEVINVEHTTAQSLKAGIDSLLMKHGLTMSRVRGVGYSGTNNMTGKVDGWKNLITAENTSAFYVNCFTHQLQLAIVEIARKHFDVNGFFTCLTKCSSIIAASPKHREIFRAEQVEKLIEGICNGEVMTGQGLNQETTLVRSGDTLCASHYRTITSVIEWFSSLIDVLEAIEEDGNQEQRGEANNLLFITQQFKFTFFLHLMKNILQVADHFSQALQRKDQDIANVLTLLNVLRQRFEKMRSGGWEELINSTCDFCNLHKIVVPNMDGLFAGHGRSRHRVKEITILHHFKVELFYTVVDYLLQELKSHFDKVDRELLCCVACLDPSDSFSAYDVKNLIRFAKFYPLDFSEIDCMAFEHQLENYILDVRSDVDFSEVKGISELAQKMVAKRKHVIYSSVYLLMQLALLLPVTTASVEQVFSAMNSVKRPLDNQMSDDLLNACLVTYIEREVFDNIDEESIMKCFQEMKFQRVL